MTERPILFSGPMVRAILAGTKTQTRRVVNAERRGWDAHALDLVCAQVHDSDQLGVQAYFGPEHFGVRCPFGKPGSRLWVRESFCDDWRESRGVVYRADGGLDADMFDAGCKWRPSIHMPRWASRITLEVEAVRVERLQDISEADARAEGCPCYVCGRTMDGLSEDDCHCFHRMAGVSDYRMLWESINGSGSWDANPWVWAITFRRITP